LTHSILMVIVVLLIAIITRSFTVLFHELAHSIKAMLLTRQKTTVYLGSYGDSKNLKTLRLGKMEIRFKYMPPFWGIGLCVPSAKGISIIKRILFTIAGPLASLLLAIAAIYFTFLYKDVQVILLLTFLFISASAVLDFLSTAIPSNHKIHLRNGNITYNDARQLKQLFFLLRLPKKYYQAWKLYEQADYTNAANILESAIKDNFENEDLYRLAINSFFHLKKYDKAGEVFALLDRKYTMSSDDYANYGSIKIQTGLYEESIIEFDKSLTLNPGNWLSLTNKGYILTVLGKYPIAIEDLNKAIKIDPLHAYPYNNRGLAKIKIGLTEEGLDDIKHSISLDSNNSYAYRNLGIYHLDRGEKKEALELFLKTKELDQNTHLIDELIAKATPG